MRIPKPQDLVSLFSQVFLTFGIVIQLAGMAVPGTVELDGKARFFAKEIEKVNSLRMLASEFVTAESAVAQPAPHELLRPSLILAKLAGAGDFGHAGKLGNRNEIEKLVLTSALTFYPLPRAEATAGGCLLFLGSLFSKISRRSFREAADDSPSSLGIQREIFSSAQIWL